jgi:hypothetical protein
MQVEQIQDYSEFNKPPYLLEQFVGTDVEKLAAVGDSQFNEFEEACINMLSGMWIDNAQGVQLDVIGIHVNLPRYGRDDATYKTLLKIQAFVNAHGGTPEALIMAVQTLYDASMVHYIPRYPAMVEISHDGAIGYYILSDIIDNNGNFLVDNHGNHIASSAYEEITDDILYGILPSGVNLAIGFPLVTMGGDNFQLVDGSQQFYALL